MLSAEGMTGHRVRAEQFSLTCHKLDIQLEVPHHYPPEVPEVLMTNVMLNRVPFFVWTDR